MDAMTDDAVLFADAAKDNWRLTEAIKQAIDLLEDGEDIAGAVKVLINALGVGGDES
jgi:hypothetical protein